MITAGFWESTFRYTVVERLESRIGYGVRSESSRGGVASWRGGVWRGVAGYKNCGCMHVQQGMKGEWFADPDNPDLQIAALRIAAIVAASQILVW